MKDRKLRKTGQRVEQPAARSVASAREVPNDDRDSLNDSPAPVLLHAGGFGICTNIAVCERFGWISMQCLPPGWSEGGSTGCLDNDGDRSEGI